MKPGGVVQESPCNSFDGNLGLFTKDYLEVIQ